MNKFFAILRQRRRSWGGGGEGVGGGGGGGEGSSPPPPPHENIGGGGGQTYRFCPPPQSFRQLEKLICNARIGLKSTVMHYKTIKFNIKIPLNIHNVNFCGALRAQSFILQLLREKFGIFLTFAPPPPIRIMDRRR